MEQPLVGPQGALRPVDVGHSTFQYSHAKGHFSHNPRMAPSTSVLRRLAYTAILSLVFGLISSSVIDAFLKKWSGTAFNVKIPYSFERTLAYDAPRPYAYRILFPWLVNTTAELLPASLVSSPSPKILERGLELYIGESKARMVPVVLQVKFIIAALWMFFFLFATLWLYRILAIQTLRISQASADLATIMFGLVLPLSFRGGGGFIYDFSEMFFSAAYIAALISGRHAGAGAILSGAIVNKESNLLLILYLCAYLITSGKNLRHRWYLLVSHFIAAVIPFLLIKFATAHKGGGTVEFYLLWNIDYWTNVSSFLGFMTTNFQLVLFPKPANVVFLALFVWMVSYRWNEKPSFVRVALLGTGSVCILLLSLFCWHDEIRNLSLAFPAIYLAVTHSIVENYKNEYCGNLSRE